MVTKINNPTRKYIYFNKSTGNIHDNLFELLNIGLIKNANLKAHENNISNYFSRPDKYQEVIEGIYPIPPRSIWKYEHDKFYNLNDRNIPSNITPDFAELLKIIEKLSKPFLHKKIGIELSGGLDTSIVIGLIKHLGFNPFLVGIKSNRYELRTESYIQEKYANKQANVCLKDSSESLPFSNLFSCPIHQLPSSTSLYYMHALQIAKESSERGINIILSGMGFDALLCENPIQENINLLPESWKSWMLDDNWFNENIYGKYGITYKSGAASPLLIKKVWAMRKGEGEDLKKWWGRKMFSDYLPKELVNYAYKADNSGEFLDGFLNSKNEISTIFKVAHEVTNLEELSQNSLDSLFHNVHLVDETKDKLILARVSFANWIFGLIREKII
jgi:hypothetical protein